MFNLNTIPACFHRALVPVKGKKPVVVNWQKTLFTEEMIKEVNPTGLGVKTGYIEEGKTAILALDFDECAHLCPDDLLGYKIISPRLNSFKLIFYLEDGIGLFRLLDDRIKGNKETVKFNEGGQLEVFFGNASQVVVNGKYWDKRVDNWNGEYRQEGDPSVFNEDVLLAFLNRHLPIYKDRKIKALSESGVSTLKRVRFVLEHPKFQTDEFGDYDEWIKVIMALKHAGETENNEMDYYVLADKWSSNVPNYDPDQFEKTWNGIKDNGRCNPRTLGTLFKMAKDRGIEFPKPKLSSLVIGEQENEAVFIHKLVNRQVELDRSNSQPEYLFIDDLITIAEEGQGEVMKLLPSYNDGWTKAEKKEWREKGNKFPVTETSFRKACLNNVLFNAATFEFEWIYERGVAIDFTRVFELGKLAFNGRILPFFGKGVSFNEGITDEIARNNRYYPQTVYAKSLIGTWDDEDRLTNLLENILQVYAEVPRIMVLKWLLGTAERWLNPGCKFDSILILHSNQGTGKSSFFEALSPLGMFDSLEQLVDKDDYLALHRCAIIELGEVDSTFRRQDVSKIKNAITRRKDLIRPPYARSTQEFPRANSLCASVNNPVFLTDDTGSRRFWVVSLDNDLEIDWNWIEKNRDQIWAQVLDQLRSSKLTSWFTKKEIALIEENNDLFKQESAIEPIIEGLFVDVPSDCLEVGVFSSGVPITTQIVLGHVLENKDFIHSARAEAIKRKIPDIMMKLGFRHGRITPKQKDKYNLKSLCRVWKLQ